MKHNLFPRRKWFLLTTPVLALIVISMVLMIMPRTAMSAETGDVCIEHFKPGAVCTANDVRIRQLTVLVIKETCEAGIYGEAVADFEMLIGAEGSPDRYDIGIFLALGGGSA